MTNPSWCSLRRFCNEESDLPHIFIRTRSSNVEFHFALLQIIGILFSCNVVATMNTSRTSFDYASIVRKSWTFSTKRRLYCENKLSKNFKAVQLNFSSRDPQKLDVSACRGLTRAVHESTELLQAIRTKFQQAAASVRRDRSFHFLSKRISSGNLDREINRRRRLTPKLLWKWKVECCRYSQKGKLAED